MAPQRGLFASIYYPSWRRWHGPSPYEAYCKHVRKLEEE